MRDTVEGFGQFGDEHPHALGNDENGHREGETGLQDIDRPVGFPRHRLHDVNTKGKQDRAKENGHDNRGGNDVVVEDIEPAWQLEVFHTLLFFPQIRRHFVGNPRGKLLLVTDGEAAAVGDQLSRLEHHVGGDTPVQGDQHGGTDDGRPHSVTKDKERDGDQPRLLKHDMASQHDGADAGYPAQQDVTDVERQQHRIAHPAIGLAHPVDGRHHRGIGVRDRAVDAVHL